MASVTVRTSALDAAIDNTWQQGDLADRRTSAQPNINRCRTEIKAVL